MRRLLRRVAVAALLVASRGGAQTTQAELEATCDPGRVMAMTEAQVAAVGPFARHHPRAILDSLAPALGRGDYASAMAAAIERARAALADGRISGDAAAKYARRLNELDRTFAVLVALPYEAQARYQADSVKPALFQLSQDAAGAFPLFAGTADQIVVVTSTGADQQRALCWPAITLDRLATTFGARRRAQTVRTLDALAKRWESYVEHSYSQLPWELYLNGRQLGRGDWEPPKYQWILLHPSAGVEANGSVWKELRRVDVAVLEPVGILRYNADYTRYLGLSGVVSFAANRNAALGAYAHLWYPQAKLGYLRRSDADRRRRGSFLVSLDLYGLLTGVPDKLQEARSSALGKQLVAATTGR